jgi:hypothetical protein
MRCATLSPPAVGKLSKHHVQAPGIKLVRLASLRISSRDKFHAISHLDQIWAIRCECRELVKHVRGGLGAAENDKGLSEHRVGVDRPVSQRPFMNLRMKERRRKLQKGTDNRPSLRSRGQVFLAFHPAQDEYRQGHSGKQPKLQGGHRERLSVGRRARCLDRYRTRGICSCPIRRSW